MKASTVALGVFSEGTMKNDEVGGAIADLLRHLRLSRTHRALIREWDALIARADENDDTTHEPIQDVCGELWTALDDYLPPYTYAGGSEWDGACYGVWPITDDDDLPRYEAGEEPAGSGDCYSVTDHGNLSCGRRLKNGRYVEYWSVV